MKNWESSKYRNRSGWSYSSDSFRTTILKGGGHIAELTMLNTKSGDINPLWSVPWDSIEPEDYEKYIGSGKYEDPPTGKAHASIMGHNLCLDTYCTPSEAEQKIRLGHHGEAPVANWDKTDSGPNYLIVEAQLTKSNLTIERKISTREDSPVIQVMETVSNKNTFDYPTLHVQHPTIGPPFLDAKNTIVDIPSSQSIVFPYDFGAKHPLLNQRIAFFWDGILREFDGKHQGHKVVIGPDTTQTSWGIVRFKPISFPNEMISKPSPKFLQDIQNGIIQGKTIEIRILFTGTLIPWESIIYAFSHDELEQGIIMPVIKIDGVQYLSYGPQG